MRALYAFLVLSLLVGCVVLLCGCKSSPPPIEKPRSLTPDLITTDAQAGKVKDIAQTATPPLPAETAVLKSMTARNVASSKQVDVGVQQLYDASTDLTQQLADAKKPDPSLPLYIIGAIVLAAAVVVGFWVNIRGGVVLLMAGASLLGTAYCIEIAREHAIWFIIGSGVIVLGGITYLVFVANGVEKLKEKYQQLAAAVRD